MSETNVPINKGHFELDTEERVKAFQNKLAAGWEDEYREYRRLWVDLPRTQILRDYPLLVDLEMSSICNLNCPMCPTVSEDYMSKVDVGLLDFEIAKKVIDEIAGKVFALRLSLVGEPTLNRSLVKTIRYAKENDIREVSFLTNGSRLDIDYFKRLAEAGADWITVSIDGLDDNYEKIRKPLKFKNILSNLEAIKRFKDDNGLLKPVIKVQSVWPSIRDNAEKFYNTIAPLVDLIAYNPLIDYLHKDTDIVYEDNFICSQLYQRLVICSNGMAKLCSNDEWREEVIGDAAKQSVHELWHSDRLNEIRSMHRGRDGFKQFPVCRHCYYPRKTEVNETSMVNGRKVLIENYINRKQVIGQ